MYYIPSSSLHPMPFYGAYFDAVGGGEFAWSRILGGY